MPSKSSATFSNLNLTTCPDNPLLPTSKWSVNRQLDLIDQTLRSECIGHEMISLSDHEAIAATIRIEKHKPGNFYKSIKFTYYNLLSLNKLM